MLENCYILYSCDGSYEPLISNYSGLSSYTSSYVSINIIELSTTPDTCFYVLDLGIIDCNPTYTININTGTTCNPSCYCYFIRSATSTTDVTFVNCDDEIVVETIVEGQTYNICSKVTPQFDSITQIPLKLTDICENNQCPPTIPSVKPTNECDVITLFPMDVECSVLQPSTDMSFDGAATLIITGGTPPYTIFWEVGSYAPALANLGIGEYKATVVDYYGDFSANTTCILTAQTQTYSGMCFVITGISQGELVYISTDVAGFKNGRPYYQIQYGVEIIGFVFWDTGLNQWLFCQNLECQGTPYNYIDNNSYLYPTGDTMTQSWTATSDSTILITQSYLGVCVPPTDPLSEVDLCFTIYIRNDRGEFSQTVNVQFEPSSDINGQTSWTATTNDYLLYWNTGSTPAQWTISSTTISNASIINNDPSYPPISNWEIYGNTQIENISVAQGTCTSAYTIFVSAIVNDADCNPTGSIIAQASGGVGPYQYSIDGGVTYTNNPIFNGLLPGQYSVFAKDSNNIIGSSLNVQIVSTPSVTYTLTLTIDYTNNTFTITSSVLPTGALINFDITHLSTFSFYPNTVIPTPLYNNVTTINTVGNLPLTNVTSNTYVLGGPCSALNPVNVFQQVKQYTNNLTMGSSQTLTGSITNNIVNNPAGECKNASGYYTLTISNGSIINCSCCDITLVNTTPPNNNPIQ